MFELDLHGFQKLIDLSALIIFCEVHVEMAKQMEIKKDESQCAPRRSRKREI